MSNQFQDPKSLADYLDSILPPGQQTTPEGDADPMVDAAIRLASAQRPQLSHEAFNRIQAQLDAAQDASSHGQSQQATPSGLRIIHFNPVLKWAAAIVLIFLVMLGGVSGAALAANPGDILYPVKQVVEDVELVLATSQQGKAKIHLIHAERRINEALTLLNRGEFDARLFNESLAAMKAAATIADKAGVTGDALAELENRTMHVNLLIDNILTQAESSNFVSSAELNAVVGQVNAARDSGQMLYTPVTTPAPVTPDVVATAPPSATFTPTITPTSTRTPTPTVTLTPTAMGTATDIPAEPTEPPILVIEGPVSAIDGNLVTIYGMQIELDADDLRLNLLRVGDTLRVTTTEADDGETISTFEFPNEEVSLSPGGQEAYRDDGNCDNRPPAWAPAPGWYARCEPEAGSGSPGNANGNAQGNANGNAQGNANGNANGNSTGNAQGNSQGNAQGNSPGNGQGNNNNNGGNNGGGNGRGGGRGRNN